MVSEVDKVDDFIPQRNYQPLNQKRGDYMDNLTRKKLGTLLNKRKLISIDRVAIPGNNEGLCLTFDCEDGKTIPFLLLPCEKDNELFIDIILGREQFHKRRR